MLRSLPGRTPSLVDVVHRVSGRSRIAPGIGWPPLAFGVRTRPRDLGVPWTDRHGCTRATSIFPRITVTPYPISHSLAMVWLDRKDFYLKKSYHKLIPFSSAPTSLPHPPTPLYLMTWWTLSAGSSGRRSSGRRPFLPGPLPPPPCPHPVTLQVSERAKRALIQQEPKTINLAMINCDMPLWGSGGRVV